MRDPFPSCRAGRDADRSRFRTDNRVKILSETNPSRRCNRNIHALARHLGECPGRPRTRRQAWSERPVCRTTGQDRECGNRGDSGLCDLPTIVVDRDVHVAAFPCRKRNMAGWLPICPATLGNVDCPGRLVQSGGRPFNLSTTVSETAMSRSAERRFLPDPLLLHKRQTDPATIRTP